MHDIYEANQNDTARFLLGIRGKRNMIVIGLNPSTANKEKSDITVSKVKEIARRYEFDGFIMANLYPLRSKDTSKLPEECDHCLFNENIEIIVNEIKKESCCIWAAWGNKIVSRKYLSDSCKELYTRTKEYKTKWFNFGDLIKNGHPRNPSRLSYNWKFNKFDIKKYCSNI